LFSTAAIELVDGKHHMFTFVDITERKRAEEKLAETNIALEKALRAKDEFMAAMSHELRTPLAGILGMVETLDDGVYGSLTDKQVKAVTVIHKNGHRLLDMVNGLIDYTHLQVGDIKPAMGNYSVDEICQSLMKKIEPSVRQKKQHTSIEIDPQVTHIQCDLVWLQKLLWPLVENASKFTPQGGEFGMIVKGNRDEKLVRLSIWDKGIGIQAQDLPRLFQPFVQLDARLSRLYDGTGLGLVLARRIAELLGGSVSVESVFGQGSRFTVTLPWLD
jgi:signal transduction histidine kinase